MKRNINIKGIQFYIANYTPRKNEFERGLKYQLYVIDFSTGVNIPTSNYFCTLKEAREFINKNYFIWL